MNKDNGSPINNKVFNLIGYLTLLLPIMILGKYLLGYRIIIWIDINYNI